MRILIQTKREEAIRVDIGYETPFHSSAYWFVITKEYYDRDGEVENARWLWSTLRHRKYRHI